MIPSFLCFLLALACAGGEADAPEALLVSVKTEPATRGPITAFVSAEGTVSARQEALLSATVSGQLVNLRPIQNTTVAAGEVLAVLDSPDFFAAQKELRQAEATVASTEALVGRRRSLFDQGGIARKDLEESELTLATAKDDLESAKRTVGAMAGSATVDSAGHATIRAPFAGVIAEQMQVGGEFVAEGTPLFKLVDIGGFVAKAEFADTVGRRLTEGSQATVADPAFGGEPAVGVVSMISKTTDPTTRTLEVWVRIDDASGALRAGDAVHITAPAESAADAVIVPMAAVVLDASNGASGSVMVVVDGVAKQTAVKVGIRSEDHIQIVEGLTGGEQVVVEGNYGLPDGTQVQVETEPAPAATDEK